MSPRRPRPPIRAVALTLVVLLAASCTAETTDGRDHRPRETGTSPSASRTVPSPRAAADPDADATETCTQTVKTLDLVMKPGPRVPGSLTEAIRATAERAHQALADVPLPGCEGQVTVVKILTGAGAANTAAQFQQVTSKRGLITIWTDDWLALSTMGRVFVLVHEWWHQIQQLSAWCGPDAGCRTGDLDEIPIWLLEGDANLQALRVADLLGLTSSDAYVQAHSGWTPRALAALRKGTGPLDLPPGETVQWYQMAQFAGDDLVDGKPLTFLRFWRLAGKTGDWHRAFRLAFGIDYEAYVDDAFMDPDHLWN